MNVDCDLIPEHLQDYVLTTVDSLCRVRARMDRVLCSLTGSAGSVAEAAEEGWRRAI